MSDSKANASITSLAEVYATASAAQTPTAPPALSAAIMQAAAQAVAARSVVANASVAAPASTAPIEFAVPESVTAKLSLPSGESWREGLALLQQLIQATATRLQNIFTIPTLRYGLPAMMVAAVGFKIALPEAPKMQNSAPPATASAPAAAPAPVAAGADIASVLPTKPASAHANSVAKTVLNNTENSETKAVQSIPSGRDESAIKNRTVLADSSKKEIWSEPKGKDNVQTAGKAAMGLPIEPSRQPQAFPAERGSSPSSGELVKSDAVLSQAKPAPLKQMLAESAPVTAVPAAPAPTASVATGVTGGVSAGSTPAFTAAASVSGNTSIAMGSNTATGLGGSTVGDKKFSDAEKAKRAAPAAMAAPAVAAAVPATKMLAKPALEPPSSASPAPSSFITKELRLRWLIATSREVDGRIQESCNTTAPKLEQVQSWLSSGANPNYVLNGVSTLALAQRCGFAEAAQAMQPSAKP
jgi:hypothetical protein